MMIGLVACRQDNPWFIVDSASSVTSSEDDSASNGSSASEAPQTGSSEPGPGSDEGDGSASTTAADSDGGGVVDTTSETTGSEASSSSDTSEDGGASETGAPELIEGTVWHDLYALCGEGDWKSGVATPMSCMSAAQTPPPWTGKYLGDWVLPGMEDADILALVPLPGVASEVSGRYLELTLPAEAKNPHLRAVVACPGPEACDISASMRVEIGGSYFAGAEELPLVSGDSAVVDIDLSDITAGEDFSVEILVVGQSESATNRGFWLQPRIVELIAP